MPKEEVIPCTKEEMNRLIESSMDSDFYYLIFNTAKLTGRRLGEFYGVQKQKEIGRKVIGKKIEYKDGKAIPLDKTRAIYKKIPGQWDGGIKVKDINFEEGLVKIWVLKRRKLEQDETVLTKENIRLLKHYIVKTKLKENDFIFRAKSYRTIQAAVESYAKKAKIDHKVSFHNFRHYFITELKRKSWTNDEIAKLTGHKTPGVITIYDHVVAKDIKERALRDLEGI